MPPFIIDDSTPTHLHSPRMVSKGYDPSTVVKEMFASPKEITLIPRSDWQAIIEERKAQGTGLEAIWRRKYGSNVTTAHLDQNGQGYCWAYSTGHAIMFTRVRDGQEPKRLSPHAVGCKIKNFKDQGGWCGLSAKFARENGYPTVDTWKEKSMSRQYDNATTWNEAKQYQITEDYVDLTANIWKENLTFDQLITCLLLNLPCQCDFDWWGHSVCMVDVNWRDGQAVPVGINSWAGWGQEGFFELQGQRAIPNSAVSTRGTVYN